MAKHVTGIEFWVVELLDEDGDFVWSRIIWGDGFSADDALKDALEYGDEIPANSSMAASGPYQTNCVAVVAPPAT